MNLFKDIARLRPKLNKLPKWSCDKPIYDGPWQKEGEVKKLLGSIGKELKAERGETVRELERQRQLELLRSME